MSERGRGDRYDELHVGGHRAAVHAGSNYNTYTITNYNYFYGSDPRFSNLQQPAQEPENGQPPQPPSYGRALSDPANVSSPSQSSDSTNAEDGYGRMIGSNSTEPANTEPSYQILQVPTREDSRYKYFLDGNGLAQHVVRRYVAYLAGPNAQVRSFQYGRRDGYLVCGMLLAEEQITELRRQSREYERERRVDRHLTSRD
jgi:hypothetical protein